MTKLGQGLLDLHSRRGDVDLDWLAARGARGWRIERDLRRVLRDASPPKEAFELADAAGIDVAARVAEAAWATAAKALRDRDYRA